MTTPTLLSVAKNASGAKDWPYSPTSCCLMIVNGSRTYREMFHCTASFAGYAVIWRQSKHPPRRLCPSSAAAITIFPQLPVLLYGGASSLSGHRGPNRGSFGGPPPRSLHPHPVLLPLVLLLFLLLVHLLLHTIHIISCWLLHLIKLSPHVLHLPPFHRIRNICWVQPPLFLYGAIILILILIVNLHSRIIHGAQQLAELSAVC